MAAYQKLFDYLNNEFNLSCVQTELQEIIRIVKETEYPTLPTDEEIEKQLVLNENPQDSYSGKIIAKASFCNGAIWMRDLINQKLK